MWCLLKPFEERDKEENKKLYKIKYLFGVLFLLLLLSNLSHGLICLMLCDLWRFLFLLFYSSLLIDRSMLISWLLSYKFIYWNLWKFRFPISLCVLFSGPKRFPFILFIVESHCCESQINNLIFFFPLKKETEYPYQIKLILNFIYKYHNIILNFLLPFYRF